VSRFRYAPSGGSLGTLVKLRNSLGEAGGFDIRKPVNNLNPEERLEIILKLIPTV
jgi:hypothetical protein